MKLRLKMRQNAPIITGCLTTEHSASSYGQPVLLLEDGRALGQGDLWQYDIIETTKKEQLWSIIMPIPISKAAAVLGISERTVQKWCKLLGFKKTGRDYILTAGQVEQIDRYCHDGPGRPKKERA